METLYIDVYFLINFTVDILAIYLAVSFSQVPSSAIRLILGGVLGAIFATVAIFLDSGLLKLIFSLLFAVGIALVSVRGASLFRRLKFFFAFLIFETLIGGAVYYAYSLLDKFVYGHISSLGGEENRELVILSLIILLSVGVFKLFIGIFTSEGRRGAIELHIEAFGRSFTATAFVDSGNLLRDPMDMRPVVLIKEGLARRYLPSELFSEREELSERVRRCIRIIPVDTSMGVRILRGIKPTRVSVKKKNGASEDIDVIIAIDKEGGTFGGHFVLLPSSAVEDVI